jgi:cyanate permease
MPVESTAAAGEDAVQWSRVDRAQHVWTSFQAVGFVGILGNDYLGASWIWLALATVGFGVGIPAMCAFFVLRTRARRSTLLDEPPA